MRRPWMFLALCLAAATARPSDIAVTFDDLPVVIARDPLARQQAITASILSALRDRRIPAVGFINANKLLVDGATDPARVALLVQWLDAGLELGNHTFSHPDLHRVGVEAFLADVEKGDAPLRALLATRGAVPRWFRHPFLHTGRSTDDRDAVVRYLAARGYRVAPVTIDNSEWIFARAYDNARGDRKLARRVADEYVRYMLSKVEYYDLESETLFQRRIPQVLLVHANALNAARFGSLADALRARGHSFIPLSKALADPAYASPDRYAGAGGISWLDRWALTRGVPKNFFAKEPRTAKWVLRLADISEE